MNMNWLKDLKVGSIVGISYGYHGDSLATIVKITKTQIHLKNGDKFRKSDGFLIGSSYGYTPCLIEATDELMLRCHFKHLQKKLDKLVGNVKQATPTQDNINILKQAIALLESL